ncbi:DUF2591 family protein [Cronobacter sakazakii]|nr:DUF2591 family protein [Cronobacter sakazakii]
MDYSKLSDRDINALVLQEIYGNQAKDKDVMRAWLHGKFKYTTNPADAWPIIRVNKIGITPPVVGHFWNCHFQDIEKYDPEKDRFKEYSHSSENPLRAAMIVFLMMQESQHA